MVINYIEDNRYSNTKLSSHDNVLIPCIKMKYLKELLMLVVSLLVLNVWLLRLNQETIYRGGDALNMIEEFAVYGLSETMFYIVGALKILSATGLLVGFFYKKSIVPCASMISILDKIFELKELETLEPPRISLFIYLSLLIELLACIGVIAEKK